MKRFAVVFAAALSISAGAWAQTDPPKPAATSEFFRLDFNLKETDSGKLVNQRNYQMMARTDEKSVSSIRSGGKVPVTNDKGFSYIDVGVNIDVRRVTQVKDELTLDITAEVSGATEPGDSRTSPSAPPVIRQCRWSSNVLIPIRKAVVIFSSDDPTSKRQMQLEITATPIH